MNNQKVHNEKLNILNEKDKKFEKKLEKTIEKTIEETLDKKKEEENKYSAINIFIIGVITTLYIITISKIAEMLSVDVNEENELKTYTMIIYIISLMGIVIGFVWFNDEKTKYSIQNWIIKWSISLGGILMLLFTIINYWDYLDDISKLTLMLLSIFSIIYYLYTYHTPNLNKQD